MCTDTWLVLGGSVNAPELFEVARRDYPDAILITTNAGIKLCKPDYYLLSDHITVEWYGKKTQEYQADGMKLIAPRRDLGQLIPLSVDELIEVPGLGNKFPWDRGKYSNYTLSGLYCIMYAINNGGKKIVLPGHEGYYTKGRLTNWDQQFSEYKKKVQKLQWQTDIWKRFVDQCPDVEFIFYGETNYPVDGPNITKISLEEVRTMA